VYLAHALVFTAEDFAQLGNNPFPLLTSFPFFGSTAEAVEAGDTQTGDISATLIDAGEPVEFAATDSSLPDQELFRLLFLGCQAAARRQRDETLALLGPPEQMLAVLREVFALLPPGLRPECSFDTLFEEGTLDRQLYWAVGLPAVHYSQRGLACFDLDRR